MTITALQLMTLAVYAEGPKHPYDVYQTLLERREDLTVKVKPGTLYHGITRMAEDGLLAPTGTDRDGNRPERTTYALTKAGEAALTAAIRDWVGHPVYEYPRFHAALSELHFLPADEAVGLLRDRRRYLDADRDAFADAHARLLTSGLPRRYYLEIELQIAELDAESRWLDGAARAIESGAIDWHQVSTHAPDDSPADDLWHYTSPRYDCSLYRDTDLKETP